MHTCFGSTTCQKNIKRLHETSPTNHISPLITVLPLCHHHPCLVSVYSLFPYIWCAVFAPRYLTCTLSHLQIMSSTIHFLLLFLACFGVANAHFKLNTPPTRGFDEDKQPTAPCGGFDTLQNPRNNLPLSTFSKCAFMHHQQA